MPWLVFAYGSIQGKRLGRLYNATQAPTLAIVNSKTGRLISDRGVELIERHGTQLFEKMEKMFDPDDYEFSYQNQVKPLLTSQLPGKRLF